MLIHSLKMNNLLSFGPDSEPVDLKPLNVIIGPNGSGKSNFLEGISLLQSASKALNVPIREGGGIRDWLWKGSGQTPVAMLEIVLDNPQNKDMALRYHIAFTESAQRLQITDERIENEKPYEGFFEPYFYYRYEHNHPVLNVKGERRELKREQVDPEQSILSQRKDPDQYPEITYLGEALANIRLYREWSFGRYTSPRLPQKPDLPNDFLDEAGTNLGLVLNRLRREPAVKMDLLKRLQALYEGIDDFDVQIEGGSVQVFFQEGKIVVPATRLSDGTLRYLCLLAVLCHPKPPPLVCIEEPELGLHPDVLPTLAELLQEASQRTQIVVTTHSDVLVDAMSDTPDSVLVCEKDNGSTTMRRLDREALSSWLDKYALGELWRMGEIGGKRW